MHGKHQRTVQSGHSAPYVFESLYLGAFSLEVFFYILITSYLHLVFIFYESIFYSMYLFFSCVIIVFNILHILFFNCLHHIFSNMPFCKIQKSTFNNKELYVIKIKNTQLMCTKMI